MTKKELECVFSVLDLDYDEEYLEGVLVVVNKRLKKWEVYK